MCRQSSAKRRQVCKTKWTVHKLQGVTWYKRSGHEAGGISVNSYPRAVRKRVDEYPQKTHSIVRPDFKWTRRESIKRYLLTSSVQCFECSARVLNLFGLMYTHLTGSKCLERVVLFFLLLTSSRPLLTSAVMTHFQRRLAALDMLRAHTPYMNGAWRKTK